MYKMNEVCLNNLLTSGKYSAPPRTAPKATTKLHLQGQMSLLKLTSPGLQLPLRRGLICVHIPGQSCRERGTQSPVCAPVRQEPLQRPS